MKYDYFLAGRSRNRANIVSLAQAIRAKGKSVYCFLDQQHSTGITEGVEEQYMQAFEARDWRTDPFIKEVFENDMAAERESEQFILLLPAGISAHIEAGVAYGLGKRCILIGDTPQAESLYHIFSAHYPDVGSFLSTLSPE